MWIIWIVISILLFYFFCYWFAVFVEAYFDENSKFKKWWRKHILDWDPNEIDDRRS
jgi:hypothetical protein